MTEEEWINVGKGAEVYLQPNSKGVCVKATVLAAYHDKRKDGAKVRIIVKDSYGGFHTDERFLKRVELLSKPIELDKIPQAKYAYRLKGTEQLFSLYQVRKKYPHLSRGMLEHALREKGEVEGEFWEHVQLTQAGTVYKVIPSRGETA